MKRLKMLKNFQRSGVNYEEGQIPFHGFSDDEAQQIIDRGQAEEVPLETLPTSHWPSDEVRESYVYKPAATAPAAPEPAQKRRASDSTPVTPASTTTVNSKQ